MNMNNSQVISYCFLYIGAVSLIDYILFFQVWVSLSSVIQVGIGFSFIIFGIIEARTSRNEESILEMYNSVSYLMIIISILLSGIFLSRVI